MSNIITIDGDVLKIKIYNKKGFLLAEALTDSIEYAKIKDYTWYLSSRGYAFTTYKVENNRVWMQLHRFVTDPNTKFQVDHINRNKLDCRKSNLRYVTSSENSHNISMRGRNTYGRKKTSSKYRGVSYCKKTKKWRGQIMLNNKSYHVGWFKTEFEAAINSEKFRKELMKKFS